MFPMSFVSSSARLARLMRPCMASHPSRGTVPHVFPSFLGSTTRGTLCTRGVVSPSAPRLMRILPAALSRRFEENRLAFEGDPYSEWEAAKARLASDAVVLKTAADVDHFVASRTAVFLLVMHDRSATKDAVDAVRDRIAAGDASGAFDMERLNTQARIDSAYLDSITATRTSAELSVGVVWVPDSRHALDDPAVRHVSERYAITALPTLLLLVRENPQLTICGRAAGVVSEARSYIKVLARLENKRDFAKKSSLSRMLGNRTM
eukprot:TRINITY_DN69062_c0_g1_i1.p1 TRINITY_DN69062_c0_g1~~TRINITY_DN69062_c0_g1_i1.p1  ORF type:complete len:264 (-),score=31.92 TRINITY_DN69062_c0_g1_i1:45-836(-)